MKRLKSLLIIVILLFPLVAKADMGAPSIRPYDIVVVDPNGVDYYDMVCENIVGHLDKDSIVNVEYQYDDEIMIRFDNDNYAKNCIKSLKGFSLVKDEVNPYDENDEYISSNSSSKKAYINNKDGVYVRKGPSEVYDVVGKIEYNTVIDYKYHISIDYSTTYIYVEYNGLKGWINILEKNVLLEDDDYYIFTYAKKIDDVFIPKYKILQAKYKSDDWTQVTYFEVDNKLVGVDNFKDVTATKIYDIKKIKLNKAVKYSIDDDNLDYKELPSDTILYIIASGYEFEIVMDENKKFYYINAFYDNKDNEFDYEKLEVLNKKDLLELFGIGVDEVNNEEKTSDKEDINNSKDLENKTTDRDIIIIAVICSLVFSLSVFVIIALINKKKEKAL